MKSQDFHLIFTGRGAAFHDSGELFDTARSHSSAAFASENARATRKTVRSSKIAWRFCFSRNPSGNVVPECGPRKRGQFWRLRNRCRGPPRRFSRQSRDTQSLVLDSSCYSRVNGIAQGGNQKRHLIRTGRRSPQGRSQKADCRSESARSQQVESLELGIARSGDLAVL